MESEQLTTNEQVGGSSPPGFTNYFNLKSRSVSEQYSFDRSKIANRKSRIPVSSNRKDA